MLKLGQLLLMCKNVLARLLRGPVEVKLSRQKGTESIRVKLSRDLAAEAIRYMLYQPAAASRIPLFIHAAAQGNCAPLAEAAISYRQQIVATGSNGLNGLDCIDNLIADFIERGTTAGLNTSCTNSIIRIGFLLKLSNSN